MIPCANWQPALSKSQQALIAQIRAGALLYCELCRPVDYAEEDLDSMPAESNRQAARFSEQRRWTKYRIRTQHSALSTQHSQRFDSSVHRHTVELLLALRVIEVESLARGAVTYSLVEK